MGASEHIGFRNWNEEECQYPVRMYVEPANKARILSYVKGMEKLLQPEVTGQGKTGIKTISSSGYGQWNRCHINGGREPVEYEIQCDNPGIFLIRKAEGLRQEMRLQ